MFNHNKKIKRDTRVSQLNHGFTLLEALVTIGLTVIILSVYTAMLTSIYFISRTQFGIQASGFVQEGLDVLRTLDFEDLSDRTDGHLLGQAYTRGEWKVTGSTDKTLELITPADDWNDETGLAILPGSYRNDFTFTADVMANNASPNDWEAGLALRYTDSENYYRLRISNTGIAFDEVYHGAVSTIWSQGGLYDKGSWYTLEVTVSGDQFSIRRNGVLLANFTDTRFSSGDLGLLAMAGALTEFDDVTVTGDGAGSWDFNSDTLGEYPNEWQRFSPFDMPGGDATLTISPYLSQATIKQATVTVSWTEVGLPRSVSASSLITE